MADNLPAIPETGIFVSTIRFTFKGEEFEIRGNKLYNSDGDVAVVYSPGYGGGWTTWDTELSPTDARVAVLTLTGMSVTLTFPLSRGDEKEVRFADSKFYPYAHSDTHGDLDIEWLAPGTLFRITEYDGFESLELQSEMTWHQA